MTTDEYDVKAYPFQRQADSLPPPSVEIVDLTELVSCFLAFTPSCRNTFTNLLRTPHLTTRYRWKPKSPKRHHTLIFLSLILTTIDQTPGPLFGPRPRGANVMSRQRVGETRNGLKQRHQTRTIPTTIWAGWISEPEAALIRKGTSLPHSKRRFPLERASSSR